MANEKIAIDDIPSIDDDLSEIETGFNMADAEEEDFFAPDEGTEESEDEDFEYDLPEENYTLYSEDEDLKAFLASQGENEEIKEFLPEIEIKESKSEEEKEKEREVLKAEKEVVSSIGELPTVEDLEELEITKDDVDKNLNVDEHTIKQANDTIKDLYKKLTDKDLLQYMSAEEIVSRDFDNLFIFEDFFDDYLKKFDDNEEVMQKLLEDIVDEIIGNDGNITIKELVTLTTSSDVYATKSILPESSGIPFKDSVQRQGDFDDTCDIVFANGKRMNLKDIDEEELETNLKASAKEQKKKMFNVVVGSSKKESEKTIYNNSIMTNILRNDEEEETSKKWNLFKRKKK